MGECKHETEAKKEKVSDNLRKWRASSNLVENAPQFFDKKSKKKRKQDHNNGTCKHCKYAFSHTNILRGSRADLRTELQVHNLKVSGKPYELIERLARHYCEKHTHDTKWKSHDMQNLKKQW